MRLADLPTLSELLAQRPSQVTKKEPKTPPPSDKVVPPIPDAFDFDYKSPTMSLPKVQQPRARLATAPKQAQFIDIIQSIRRTVISAAPDQAAAASGEVCVASLGVHTGVRNDMQTQAEPSSELLQLMRNDAEPLSIDEAVKPTASRGAAAPSERQPSAGSPNGDAGTESAAKTKGHPVPPAPSALANHSFSQEEGTHPQNRGANTASEVAKSTPAANQEGGHRGGNKADHSPPLTDGDSEGSSNESSSSSSSSPATSDSALTSALALSPTASRHRAAPPRVHTSTHTRLNRARDVVRRRVPPAKIPTPSTRSASGMLPATGRSSNSLADDEAFARRLQDEFDAEAVREEAAAAAASGGRSEAGEDGGGGRVRHRGHSRGSAKTRGAAAWASRASDAEVGAGDDASLEGGRDECVIYGDGDSDTGPPPASTPPREASRTPVTKRRIGKADSRTRTAVCIL